MYYSKAESPGIEGGDKGGLGFGKKLEGSELYCAQSKILGIISKYLEESQASDDYYKEFFNGYSKTDREAMISTVNTLRDSIKATMANIDEFLGGFRKVAKFNLEPQISPDITGKDCRPSKGRSFGNQGGYISKILDESPEAGSRNNNYPKESLFRNEGREILPNSKNSKEIFMANIPVLNTNKQALLDFTSNFHKSFTGGLFAGPRDLIVESKTAKASFTISPQKSPQKNRDAQRIIPRGDQGMKYERTNFEASLTPGLVPKSSDYTMYKKNKVLSKTFGTKGFFAQLQNSLNPTKLQINSFNVADSQEIPGFSRKVRNLTLNTRNVSPGGFMGDRSAKENREKNTSGIDVGMDLCLQVRPMQGMNSELTKSMVQLPKGKSKVFIENLFTRNNQVDGGISKDAGQRFFKSSFFDPPKKLV